MSDNYDALDRNLTALLTRAYVAVHARESFRARLLRDFVARASRRAHSTRPKLFERPLMRVAAAAAVLLGIFAGGLWYARRAQPHATLDEILARGDVAVRRERDGAWSATKAGPDAAPIRFEASRLAGGADEAQFLEVHTPRGAPARVEMGAIAAENSMVWRLFPDSELKLDRAAADSVIAELDAGGVLAERADAKTDAKHDTTFETRVKTSEGDVVLERGAVRVAYEAPDDPSVWEARPNASRAWVHVSVRSGRALTTRAGGPMAFGAASETYLSGGETLLAIEAADIASSGERTTVDATQPSVDEPATPAADALLIGTVTRASDGAPVEDFRVVLLPLVYLPQVGQPSVQEFRGAHGRFEFARSALRSDSLGAEGYRLEIQSAGLAPFRIDPFTLDASAARSIAAVLDEGATVRGIVVDAESGLPIADAYVVSENDTPLGVLAIDPNENAAQVVVSTRTNSDGSFELAHLSTGPQLLRATAAGHGPRWSEPLKLARGEVYGGIELRLDQHARIQGSILDSTGAPIGGLQVIASTNDFERKRPCLTFDWTTSAADGTFELEGLGSGEWSVLKFGARTQARPSLTPEIAFTNLRAGQIARVDFHARQPRQMLRGVVRDAAGKTLAGRNVMVAPVTKAGPPPDGEWTSAMSASDGSYEIPDLEPGTYELFVSGRLPSEVVRVERFEVAAGRASTHDVVLPLASITGTVRDGEKHAPLDFAVLVLMRRDENGALDFVGKVFSDAGGRFEFPYLRAGVYAMSAFATSGDLGNEFFEPITVADGARVEHVDFELRRGGALDLHVVDEAGRPIERATIVLHDASAREEQFSGVQRTDVEGRFSPSGIKPGRWTVSATAAGFDAGEREVDLVAGERTKAELVLKRSVEQR